MDRKPIGGPNINLHDIRVDIDDDSHREFFRDFRLGQLQDILEEDDSMLSDDEDIFDQDDSIERAMVYNALRPQYRPI